MDSGYWYLVPSFHCAITFPETQAIGQYMPSLHSMSPAMAKPPFFAPGTKTRSGWVGSEQLLRLVSSLVWLEDSAWWP